MECCQPLGGSTGCGHMTGRLTNHLSEINPYISSCGLGLLVCCLCWVAKVRTLSADSQHRPDPRVNPHVVLRSSHLMDCVRLSGSLPEGDCPVSVRPLLIVRSSLLADCVRLSGSLPEGEHPVTVSSVSHHVRE